MTHLKKTTKALLLGCTITFDLGKYNLSISLSKPTTEQEK